MRNASIGVADIVCESGQILITIRLVEFILVWGHRVEVQWLEVWSHAFEVRKGGQLEFHWRFRFLCVTNALFRKLQLELGNMPWLLCAEIWEPSSLRKCGCVTVLERTNYLQIRFYSWPPPVVWNAMTLGDTTPRVVDKPMLRIQVDGFWISGQGQLQIIIHAFEAFLNGCEIYRLSSRQKCPHLRLLRNHAPASG